MSAPADEYRRRLDARRADQARWSRLDAQIAYLRLALFAILVVLAVLAVRGTATPWLLAVPVVVFGALVRWHERVIAGRDDAARAVAFYERGLARIDDRWAGTGETGDRFRQDDHLYANDLDLFGRGSLFELLSIARTPAGEETLAAWLKAPAAPDEIAARHDAIAELTEGLDLREALGRAGADVRANVHTDAVLAWAEDERRLGPPALRWMAVAFTAAIVLAIVTLPLTRNVTPLLALLIAQSLFSWPQRSRIEHALHGASGVLRDLDVLAHLLQRIERHPFRSSRLAHLQQRLGTQAIPASVAIRRLHRLVEVHEWQHNLVFLVVSLPLIVGTHLAWAIETWRARHGRHIREWLAAAGEFEALASLSAYRFEHPDDPFPTIVTGSGALFDGRALGHPLLPAAHMVRNDVRIGGDVRVLVVSGSNMSGKSTLLRTVGINAVMALAGAPVRAGSLRLSRLAPGATLRIQDSLQEGRSRFYAEITRVREIADVAGGTTPRLFLLDELFHGTNSHDRLVGGAGVLRSLVERGAIGLITTHDLALAAIADELAPRAANVHFEDWFDGDEMRFDYRMKPGPVTRSNALALMRAVGLKVDS